MCIRMAWSIPGLRMSWSLGWSWMVFYTLYSFMGNCNSGCKSQPWKAKGMSWNSIKSKKSICFTNPGSCCLKSPYAALRAGLSAETERLLKPSPLGPLSPSHSNFYQGFAVPSDVDVWMQRHSTAVTAFAAAMWLCTFLGNSARKRGSQVLIGNCSTNCSHQSMQTRQNRTAFPWTKKHVEVY